MTPVLVVLLLFVVALGRLVAARGEVDAAARDAARAATNARSQASAREFALEAASATLRDRGVECRALDVLVDTSEFRADGLIRARVSCAVDLESVAGLGLPAARTLTASFTAPVDRFRGLEP